MDANNYFVKLLMLSTKEDDFLLLYGFCSATTQDPYIWREQKVNKTGQTIWRAVLTEDDCDNFFVALTKSGVISLANKSFTSPQLLKRPVVLANDGQTEKMAPITQYRKLTEYWNINKRSLFQKVIDSLNAYGADGKELYQYIVRLFNWVSQECGISLFSNGYRFGNFEFYHPTMYTDSFEIEHHNECDLQKTTVRKKQKFEEKLIVNCTSKHRERTISNETKIFLPEEDFLEFIAQEPMSQVIIQIWDEKNGTLIFSENKTLMMDVSIDMQLGGALYQVRDPWSQKLLKSASNRSELIKKHIETVSRTRSDDVITINSTSIDLIDAAIEEGYKLFAPYNQKSLKGAFIENQQKDGEIQSFLKIIEYIEPSSVKQVIIADPFFSINAAEKILARIPRSDVQIDIITSLTKIDPDTGQSLEVDMGKSLETFLKENATILHPNLLVCNLSRSGNQVFHDRYLLRYFKDGRIDGFLLSNSLNSMGQFYPFVIAPMEQEVCLEVASYLDRMRDPALQKKISKKERITCNVLFDSNNKQQTHQKSMKSPLPLNTYLPRWYRSDNHIQIPEQDIEDAVSTILEHWCRDEKLACKMLCLIAHAVIPYTAISIVADVLREKDGVVDLLLEVFVPLAKEAEKSRNHSERGIETQEYMLWMLLNGNAKPRPSGFSKIQQQAGHIWYSEDLWLHAGYDLLLCLNPQSYMKLLEEIKSPLMFDILATRMMRYPWSDELFYTVLDNGNIYSQILCADWVFQQLQFNSLSFDQIKDVFSELIPEKRVIQTIRLLSEITFYTRSAPSAKKEVGKWSSICDWLLTLAGSDITKCTSEIQEKAIFWLDDCEALSNARLHLNLAKLVTELPVRNKLLDAAIAMVQKEILDCSYDGDVDEMVSLYFDGINARYNVDGENEIFRQILDWSVFETATEPELKNYAFKRWYEASIRAKRQMKILYYCLDVYPDSAKVKKWIDMWGPYFLSN